MFTIFVLYDLRCMNVCMLKQKLMSVKANTVKLVRTFVDYY